jgi:short subunit dehydrogenase-like uncharacterized protein
MTNRIREYDLILLGASGFTGKLVAEYLLRTYGIGEDLNWAIAGRNQAKLESIRDELQGQSPAQSLSILLTDSHDEESLNNLARQTTVICSTVGPYALLGSEVVAACAANGTHYCDLTGEVQWMQRMIEAHEGAAQASGARLVHTCGFDSIPSDLGVLFMQNAMQEQHGVPATHVKYRVGGFSGAASGGTIASMINMFDEMAVDPTLQERMADPYSLLPAGAPRGTDVADQTGAVFDADFDRWTIPFMMAGINTRVVRRSNALLDFAWGEDFNYDEATLIAEGKGALAARMAVAATVGGMAAMSVKPLRAVLMRFLPSPGEGPTPQQQEKGYFDIRMLAIHPQDSSKNLMGKVYGDRDPGYGSTAKMLGESAVCLAKDALTCGGGFWTPASAMGDALISRLQTKAGVTFTLEAT